jgi:hypothetical protein
MRMVVAAAVVGVGGMALVGAGSRGVGGGIMQSLHKLCSACDGGLAAWCGGESRRPGGRRVDWTSASRLSTLWCTGSSIPQSTPGLKADDPSYL